MRPVSAEVFDPALSGDYDTPPRLELLVADLPDEPTYAETTDMFTVTHRHWLASIFADSADLVIDGWNWDEDDTRHCAAVYNTLTDRDTEAVVPVTVAGHDKHGGVWQDYYVKITRVQRLLNRLEKEQGVPGYELVPDATYLDQKMIAWTLAHPRRVCVVCTQRAAEKLDGSSRHLVPTGMLPSGCPLVKVRPHRLVPMCVQHRSEWNESAREHYRPAAG